jgi:hypothetical protein
VIVPIRQLLFIVLLLSAGEQTIGDYNEIYERAADRRT